eukprot:jgi/Galph1/1143/GphlegSOOS_G5909.1
MDLTGTASLTQLATASSHFLASAPVEQSSSKALGLLSALPSPLDEVALFGSAAGVVFGFPYLTPKGPDPKKDPWYQNIRKPRWQPPNWLFPAVWIPLKVLQTTSLYLLWKKEGDFPVVATTAFLVHISFGNLWNYLFFARRNMFASLFAMGGFWISLAGTIFFFHKVDLNAAYLLIPTQVWATIAAALNFHTYWLNRKPKDKNLRDANDNNRK